MSIPLPSVLITELRHLQCTRTQDTAACYFQSLAHWYNYILNASTMTHTTTKDVIFLMFIIRLWYQHWRKHSLGQSPGNNTIQDTHYRQNYWITRKHNRNTRIWFFDLLEMAKHQPQTSFVTLMQPSIGYQVTRHCTLSHTFLLCHFVVALKWLNGDRSQIVPTANNVTKFQLINNIMMIPWKLWKMLSEVLKMIYFYIFYLLYFINFGDCKWHFSPVALHVGVAFVSQCLFLVSAKPIQQIKISNTSASIVLSRYSIFFLTVYLRIHKKPSEDGRPHSGLPCNDNQEVHEAH